MIYYAGRFEDRARLRAVAEQIAREYGMAPTSRWLSDQAMNVLPCEPERADYAARGCEDILRADRFVLVLPDPPPARQAHSVELGYALALRQLAGRPRVQLIGPRTDNLFHWHRLVESFATIEAWIEQLRAERRGEMQP